MQGIICTNFFFYNHSARHIRKIDKIVIVVGIVITNKNKAKTLKNILDP